MRKKTTARVMTVILAATIAFSNMTAVTTVYAADEEINVDAGEEYSNSVEQDNAPVEQNNTSADQDNAPAEQPAAEQNNVPAEQNQAPAEQPAAEQNNAPVEQDQAPAEQPAAEQNNVPAEQNQVSVEQNQAPAEQNNAPAEQNQAPAEQPAAEQNNAPAEQDQAPAEQQPAAEQINAPVEQNQVSVEQNNAPAELPAEEQNETPAELAAAAPVIQKMTRMSAPLAVPAPAANVYDLGEVQDDVIMITESGSYTIKGSGSQQIVVQGNVDVEIVLEGDVNITTQTSDSDRKSAIRLEKGANVRLVIDGSASVSGWNGVEVVAGTTLTVTGVGGKEGTDSLTAAGNGKWGCGIGFYNKAGGDAGNITIKDIAKLAAYGGGIDQNKKKSDGYEGGAAIGGGRSQDINNGKVTLENIGEVYAQGGSKGAAIGAGFWRGTDVEIRNVDSVTAIGGDTAAAIGSSRNAYSGATYDKNDRTQHDDGTLEILSTNITIENSTVDAAGGYYAAGIGAGYYDTCLNDPSRPEGYDYHTGELIENPGVRIEIGDGAQVTARGGQLAAAIGGGYKVNAPEIIIREGAVVTAYAGVKENSGSKIPSAIGSGADGSGIFSDNNGIILIEDGAQVTAFSYGYESMNRSGSASDPDATTTNKGILGNKWAISRDLQDGETDATILQGRLLVEKDIYREMEDHPEIVGEMKFYDVNSAHTVQIIDLRNENNQYEVEVPAGYSSFAVTVPAGVYKLMIDGEVWSYLENRGYSAVNDGTGTINGKIGGESVPVGTKAGLIYGQETDSADAYAEMLDRYHTYGDSNSDLVTIHYVFDDPSATFKVEKGIINEYDAIAVRGLVEPVVPEEEPAEEEEQEPEVLPETVPTIIGNATEPEMTEDLTEEGQDGEEVQPEEVPTETKEQEPEEEKQNDIQTAQNTGRTNGGTAAGPLTEIRDTQVALAAAPEPSVLGAVRADELLRETAGEAVSQAVLGAERLVGEGSVLGQIRTGDESSMAAWFIAMAGSLTAILAILAGRRRKK